jgi:hypothetical protein
MLFFHRKLAFKPIDPLDDGLRDDIEAEQRETETIDLQERFDPDFEQKWDEIVKDVEKDPDWFFDD